MKLSKVSTLTILPPLLVMLLLTLLVGLTGFHLTNTWRQSTERTLHRSVQAVLLTNTRHLLEEVHDEWPEHPTVALKHWQEAQDQVALLSRNGEDASRFANLTLLLRSPVPNQSRLHRFLQQSGPSLDLLSLNQELDALGAHSSFVTLVVTLCMLGLGGFLTLLTAWDLNRLLRELIRSRDLNIRLQEEERRRIASELHDGVVQELVDLKRHYDPQKLTTIVNNLRRVCQNLKPQVLEDLGLLAALEYLADDLRQAGVANVQMTMDGDGLRLLPESVALPLFRVIQEMFSNIKKHAQATLVQVTLVYNPVESPLLKGYVHDDGQGFKPTHMTKGTMGLAGMRERIEQLGGTFHLESKSGHGTRFRFSIPIPAAPPGKEKEKSLSLSKESSR
jgi:two-component system, NarL family, sensor histidine kinase DegS